MTGDNSTLESDAQLLAHHCRTPAELWDDDAREQGIDYLETLADAGLSPDHAEGLLDRLSEWAEDDCDDLVDDLREYAIEAKECVQAREDEQAGGWRAEYETTTHRGPDRYPVPEDWTLGIVEGDGISWKRPPYPDTDAPTEWSPEDRAGTLNEFDAKTDERTVKFDVNGDPVFTVTQPDRDELMRAIAEVLRRVARGEEHHDVDSPEEYGAVEADDCDELDESNTGQTASLGDFGGVP